MVKDIYITLIANKLVFYDHFPEDNDVIKEWHFQSNSIEKYRLEDFYSTIIPNEIGWSSYDIEITDYSIRFSVMPTFFVNSIHEELSESNQKHLKKMIQKLDEFVKENIVELQVPIIKKNEFSNDSLMFIFKEPGHNSSAIFDRFVKELAANNIC